MNSVALVQDNPIIEKDASTTLRAPATLWVVAGAGLALFALVAFVHVVNEPSARELRYWQTFEPSGRAMFIAVCGALLFLSSLFVPAVASSAIAGERERGTLPLLIVSALSPARIVAGKLVSLLIASAPFFLLAVPMFGLASIYGGVSMGDVVIALCATAFHVVCLAAAGIGASSVVARARIAAPLAMLFAAVPSFFFAIPAMVAMERYVDGKDATLALPLLVSGGAVSAAFAAACLLLARDQLAPASAPRWRLRRAVVGFLLVGLPVIAAASLRFLDVASRAYDYDKDDFAAVTAVFTVLVMAVTCVLEVCVSDTRPRALGEASASPRGRALVVSGLAALGILVASLVPQAGDAELPELLVGASIMESAHVGLVVVALWLAFVAGAAGVASRIVKKKPALRVILALVFVIGVFVVPFPLHELRFLWGGGELPFGFTNPVIVLVEGGLYGERLYAPPYAGPKVSLAASLAFFTLGGALLMALAKGRRAS
jgi:hypothetical protein